MAAILSSMVDMIWKLFQHKYTNKFSKAYKTTSWCEIKVTRQPSTRESRQDGQPECRETLYFSKKRTITSKTSNLHGKLKHPGYSGYTSSITNYKLFSRFQFLIIINVNGKYYASWRWTKNIIYLSILNNAHNFNLQTI